MKNSLSQEIIVAVIFVLLLVLLLDPLMLLMPSQAQMLVLVGLLLLFGIFAGIVWRERARDEREALHRMLADRFGYLAGALVLLAAILVQGLNHSIDQWLIAALGVMIVARLAGFIYGRMKH